MRAYYFFFIFDIQILNRVPIKQLLYSIKTTNSAIDYLVK